MAINDCPLCKAEGTLEVCVDAYVVYGFKGFDDSGQLSTDNFEAPALRTDEFEDTKVVCSACGEDIDWTMFLPPGSIKSDDTHLVIKFGENAGQLIPRIGEAWLRITVNIEYNEGADPQYPALGVIMRASDDSIEICNAGEGGAPLFNEQHTVSYTDIKSITIL